MVCQLLVLAAFAIQVYAEHIVERSGRTEVIFIGTVHNDMPGYTSDSLATILEQVQPDVILLEGDQRCLDEQHHLIEMCRKGLEARAILAYTREHDVPLRACDMENLEQIMKDDRIIQRSEFINAEITSLHQAGRLTNTSNILVARAVENQRIQGLFSTPREVNCDKIDSITKWASELGDSISGDPALSDSCKKHITVFARYWTTRNQTIANKIRLAARDFPGKRLVFLCGSAHRREIREALLADSGFVLREYWQVRQTSKSMLKAGNRMGKN